MKRVSRIALTLAATTGALSGAAVTVASVASSAAGGSPVSSAQAGAVRTPASAAERARLSRQSAALRLRMQRLDRDIATARRRLLDDTRRASVAAAST